MRGFEDNSRPVTLYLLPGSVLGEGPFEIDGARAELDENGITATVGGTRYWVPVHLIDHIEQALPPAGPPAQEPEQGGGGNPGDNGGGGDDGLVDHPPTVR